jgi:hypothetical protein
LYECGGGLSHARGGTVTDFAQPGAAGYRGGQLDLAGESFDRERAVGEKPSQPLDLLNAVDHAGAGVLQAPGQQIAAVMVEPRAAGGTVTLTIVWVDVVVQLTQLLRERSEIDLGAVFKLEGLWRGGAAGSDRAAHMAMYKELLLGEGGKGHLVAAVLLGGVQGVFDIE